jgi:cell division protein FtsL
MEVTIPVALLISLATFLITVGGTWFVTQRRIRDLELKVSQQDLKYEQILIEINSIKVEIAKVQGSIIALDDKFALFIQGKIKSA